MAVKFISFIFLGLFLFQSTNIFAQQPEERVVLISNEIRNDSVHLSWNYDETAENYTLFSRGLDDSDWAAPLAILPTDSLSFSFPLPPGASREIAIFKSDPDLYRDTFSVPAGNYQVFLEDQFGKGLCCNFGIGFFRIKSAAETLFEAGEFDFEFNDSFELAEATTLYLEIQPDLFGNHLGWEVLHTNSDSIVSSFGPLGTYLRRAPSLGMIAVANKTEMPIPNQSILILVEGSLYPGLSDELAILSSDFIRSGFFPTIIPVPKDFSAAAIKSIIQEANDSLVDLTHLYLIGHVPVPYSGDMYPDTHSEHKGAWAADTYYADLDGLFTDETVDISTAFFERNHNVPGDGKFDQSEIPSELELIVGRIDFSEMGVISNDEMLLTKQYLQKVHLWKTAIIKAEQKGLVDDNFGRAFGAPASNGWRNLAALLGPENVSDEDFRTSLTAESHLWAYGCGSGTQVSADGVASTADLADDSLQVIFLMTFGSNFGDWDNHDNFLRAPLASGTTLSNIWVGNPHYFLHQMGVGKSLGATAFKNMNSDYLPGPQLMHLALMGDPTLTQHNILPLSVASIDQAANAVELNWEAPSPANNYQYSVYHKNHQDSSWQALNTTAITDTFFNHLDPASGPNYYLIQPQQLITNNSGCFYQSGLGHLDSIDVTFVTTASEIVSNDLHIWPNPGNELLILENLSLDKTLKIYDQKGMIIFQNEKTTADRLEINTGSWPAGIYLIQCGKQKGKFIKVNN